MYIIAVTIVCRNFGLLADILHRYSRTVDTGIVLIQSSGRGSIMTLDALFFTRVHFDIFGLFFPRAVSDLRSALKLLAHVYGAEKLTFCVASSKLSPQSASSLLSTTTPSRLLNSRSNCNGAVNHSLAMKEQTRKVFQQELTTLRRLEQ